MLSEMLMSLACLLKKLMKMNETNKSFNWNKTMQCSQKCFKNAEDQTDELSIFCFCFNLQFYSTKSSLHFSIQYISETVRYVLIKCDSPWLKPDSVPSFAFLCERYCLVSYVHQHSSQYVDCYFSNFLFYILKIDAQPCCRIYKSMLLNKL